MNSKTVLVAIVVLLLLLGGGFLLLNKKQTTVKTPMTTAQSQNAKPTGSNVFSSIKDALSKSVSLVCTFTDEQGKQTKSYIKNGAVRVDFTGKTAAETGSTIMKDKKVYFWNTNQKTGFMMQLTDAQLKGETVPTGTVAKTTGTQSTGQQQNVVAMLEKFKDSCKPGVVDASLFTPPADVTFSDYSKMMNVPTGTGSGGTPTQQQIQDLMKQYAPTNTP